MGGGASAVGASLSSSFKNTGGASMGSEEIRSVAAKYQSLIGNIKASGRKCLDVENEQLRNDFQTFKRQVRKRVYPACARCTSKVLQANHGLGRVISVKITAVSQPCR